MPRPKNESRAALARETRDLLLDAAIREFAAAGYEGANVNRISESAGFAKGTVYNYFPSKRDLMLAVIDEIATLQNETIENAVGQHSNADERLAAFFGAGFAFAEQKPDHARVVIETLYGPDAGFKMHLYDVYRRMFRLMGEDIIAYGIAQGTFRPIDIDNTVALLLTIYLGSSGPRDEQGRVWLNPAFVAQFALKALSPGERE